MQAAGSLLSLKSAAGKLGFLVAELASLEQGRLGTPRHGWHEDGRGTVTGAAETPAV